MLISFDSVEATLTLMLLIIYSVIIIKLYKKIRPLREMKEERNAIIVQIVIFWCALIFEFAQVII